MLTIKNNGLEASIDYDIEEFLKRWLKFKYSYKI